MLVKNGGASPETSVVSSRGSKSSVTENSTIGFSTDMRMGSLATKIAGPSKSAMNTSLTATYKTQAHFGGLFLCDKA
jgi:hypothetical protein